MTKTASSSLVSSRISRGTRFLLISPAAAMCFVILGGMLTPASYAQRAGGFVVSPAGRGGGAGSQAAGPLRGRLARAHRARHRYGALGYGPYFYPDYETDEGDVAEPPTRVTNQPASVAVAQSAKAADSIVMELRGDHWVRLTSMGPMEVNGSASAASPYVQAAALPQTGSSRDDKGSGAISAFDATSKPSELPAAVLVFRDGHREDAPKYTIVGGVIYIKSDYWANGAWTHKVNIAELDVPATLKENQSRGAHFALPSRPGEVMMRP